MDIRILRLNFNSDYFIDIELLDTPIAQKWVESYSAYQKYAIEQDKNKGYTVNRFNIFPYDGLPTLNDELSSERNKNAIYYVNEINRHIFNINNSIEGSKFPYSAYPNMPFSQTNLLHRCFTTGEATKCAWKHNLGHKQLIQLKKDFYFENTGAIKKFKITPQFKIIDEEAFTIASHGINECVHRYEGLFSSNRGLEKESFNNEYIYFHWDYFDENFCIEPGAGKAMNSHIRPTYEEVKKSITSNLFEYDVFIGRSILGKDYPTAYFNYDDILEWDVTNLGNIDGSIHIHYDKFDLEKLYTKSPFGSFCAQYGLEKEMYFPIPLGKIVDINFYLQQIEWPYDNTTGTYTSGYQKPSYPFQECIPSLSTISNVNII